MKPFSVLSACHRKLQIMKFCNRKYTYFILLQLALCCIAPTVHAQYMNNLYDYDSTGDFGFNIFIRPDSSLFILGGGENTYTHENSMICMSISGDGKNILSKRGLSMPGYSVYYGNPGTIKKVGSGYAVGVTIQGSGPNLSTRIGMAHLDSLGDTLLFKLYTDTTIYSEVCQNITIMHDGGFLIVGGRYDTSTASQLPSALIIRADSMGNMLWEKAYKYLPTRHGFATDALELNDHRIVMESCAYRLVITDTSMLDYYYNQDPWFVTLDSNGNILKDTLWNDNGIGTAGGLTKDVNGGYFIEGVIDSMTSLDPTDAFNFPYYLAHIDTNFRIQWIDTFTCSLADGQEDLWNTIQFADDNYLVFGDFHSATSSTVVGWASKISKTGKKLWDHKYVCDTREDSYLVDAAIKAANSIVLVGAATSDTLPKWRWQDVWLVEVDSNGCIEPGGCDSGLPTVVSNQQVTRNNIAIYPNPTTGRFIVNASLPGNIIIYNIEGMITGQYNIAQGTNTFQIPNNVSPGIYIVKYTSLDNSNNKILRLIYQQ